MLSFSRGVSGNCLRISVLVGLTRRATGPFGKTSKSNKALHQASFVRLSPNTGLRPSQQRKPGDRKRSRNGKPVPSRNGDQTPRVRRLNYTILEKTVSILRREQ